MARVYQAAIGGEKACNACRLRNPKICRRYYNLLGSSQHCQVSVSASNKELGRPITLVQQEAHSLC